MPPRVWHAYLRKRFDPVIGLALIDPLKPGDADSPTVEHGAQILRLFGGGAFGDSGAPRAKSQLAILPGTSHLDLIKRGDWIAQLNTVPRRELKRQDASSERGRRFPTN
jgi:hypothetical protein